MTEEITPTARIQRIEVKGLFGLYDHVIDLNLEDRVTILHGPNGVGKTILLKMVRALLANQVDELVEVPFHSFKVHFTSGEVIDISAETSTRPSANDDEPQTFKTLHNTADPTSHACTYQRRVAYPPPNIFMDVGMNGALSRQFPTITWRNLDGGPLWRRQAHRAEVHFIEAQRLLRHLNHSPNFIEATSHLQPAVWRDAIDLRRRIGELLRLYGTTAQELDQSFPTRLMQRSGQSLPLATLKARMTALESLRSGLQNNGILDERRAKPFDIASLDDLSPAQSEVMALYVEDNETKLNIFVDLMRRIDLMLRIINGRFRNKTLRADSRQGLVVMDHHGQPLELRALSSGEQQQIVLVYDLLFRVAPDTLVLIDEPELSLHVLWQKRFLPDLLEIVKVAQIDALIATHSPFIVGDRSDLMVALDAEIDHDEPLQS